MDIVDQAKSYLAANAAESGADVLIGELISEVERLRAGLDPFADEARWAERNGHDLLNGWDMLLRGPGGEIRGHLGVQSRDFVNALRAMNGQPLLDEDGDAQ